MPSLDRTFWTNWLSARYGFEGVVLEDAVRVAQTLNILWPGNTAQVEKCFDRYLRRPLAYLSEPDHALKQFIRSYLDSIVHANFKKLSQKGETHATD